MNKFQKDVLSLISSSLNGSALNIDNLDYNAVYVFAKRQQIAGLLYDSLSKTDGFLSSEIYDKFFNLYIANLQMSENQSYEIDNLLKNFDEDGIDYLPLKGTVLKKLYPRQDMRSMSDADILIKLEQLPKINEIMKNCGFSYEYESDHELSWIKDKVHIELHKRLIPSYNKDYYDYYGDGWKFIKDNQMNKEDFFIYIFTHFAKHYRDGGVGIKYMVDFYVYTSKYQLNYGYIEEELKKLQLYDFYINITDAINVWFNKKEETDKTNFITDFVFESYVYGNEDTHAKSGALKISRTTKTPKIKKVFTLIFPSYKTMVLKYSVLKKLPILLPFAYVYRAFEILFTRPKRIKKNLKELKYYSTDSIKGYQEQLNYVGLDYNFDNKQEKQ